MKTCNSLPPFILGAIQENVRRKCEKTGYVCRHWVDKKIMDDLLWLDKKDKGDRAQRYWEQCHSPEFIYRPDLGIGMVVCKLNDFRSGSTCSYQNSKAADELMQELNSYPGKECNHTES